MNKKIVASSLIGQVIEWYDFILYGFFASILVNIFFPHENHVVGLMEVFGTFAAGFLTRPLGACIFGNLGDRYGRKSIFSITIILMGIPSILIGLLPTYSAIGILAPILLLILRMIQGLSCGGEFTGSIIFLGEHAPNHQRGFYSSLAWIGSLTGTLLGSIAATLTTSSLSQNSLYQWGWRLPFIFGGLAIIIGVYFRRMVDEPLIFKNTIMQGDTADKPFLEAFLNHKKSMALIMGMNAQLAVLSYMAIVYMPTYLSSILGLPINIALLINTISIFSLILLIPLFGWISDTVGRKPVLIFSILGIILFVYPAYWMINNKNYLMIGIGQSILILLAAAMMGAGPSAMIEQVPTRLRFVASSIPYNLIICILGGTAPLMATYLIHETGNILSPSLYLLACSIISLVAICKFPESFKKAL